jgi:hypothetical protein
LRTDDLPSPHPELAPGLGADIDELADEDDAGERRGE